MVSIAMSVPSDRDTTRRPRSSSRPAAAANPVGSREDRATGSAVPPAGAERPKGWFARFLDAISRPVESNFDNP